MVASFIIFVRGVEGGGLAEFTEVVYKLKEGWTRRTLGQNISSVLHIISPLNYTAFQQFLYPKDFMLSSV